MEAAHVWGAARSQAILGVKLQYSCSSAMVLQSVTSRRSVVDPQRGASLQSLSHCISELMRSLDADSAKLARIAVNNNHYRNAVRGIWKDAQAARMILDHTNAFYVRRDDSPRKGVPEGGAYVVSEVCVDDPLVRSELDTHRELLQFALRSNGLSFDELKIVPSRRGMKGRHPFRSE